MEASANLTDKMEQVTSQMLDLIIPVFIIAIIIGIVSAIFRNKTKTQEEYPEETEIQGKEDVLQREIDRINASYKG